MSDYWTWFDDEGETKGDQFSADSDSEAALEKVLKYEEDLRYNTTATAVLVRDGHFTVTEYSIEDLLEKEER